MLMLNISSAAKLVAMTVAGFMLASTTTIAAPVLNLHIGGDTLPAIDCVKITGTDTNRVSLLQGEQLPIKIDTSGCDPSLVDTAQPWTLTLVNCHNHADTLKLVELVGGTDQKEYNWAVQTQPNNILDVNTNAASPTDSNNNKYHIQVDALSKDGTERLTGRTASFTIDINSLQKRDDEAPVVAETPETPAAPIVDAVANSDTPAIEGAINPEDPTDKAKEVSPAVANPVVPDVLSTPVVPATDPVISTDPPVVLNTPIDPLAVVPAVPETTPAAPAPASAPVPAVVPSPTYPNIPPEIVEPAAVPSPSGPNQPDASDPKAPQVITEPKKRPSTSEVFFKYAGAGSAILSTIGMGVGGLVGGIIGGTAGLVIGITAALVNSLYYAPNVA
ncbi:hypothetical protein EC991_009465 [Linnemannia zychae]|nr:hypothetical protein EC991_009465 [Linnemannia zychae]